MIKTLDTIERDDVVLLRESWELSKQMNTNDKLGDLFFTELCKTAPHVIHLFKRPKKIQAFQVCVCVCASAFLSSARLRRT